MTPEVLLGRAGHVAAALLVLVLAALAGRRIAGVLRTPAVIGEIAAGLALGPVVLALVGERSFAVLVPDAVLDVLRQLGDAALVLFLVGVVCALRHDGAVRAGRAVARVTAGAFALPLVTGLLFAGWVLHDGDPALRGGAPAPALVLLLAVSLAITAVPVLARLVEDRGSADTRESRLALSSAIAADAAGWLLLALALALAAGTPGRLATAVTALVAGAVAAFGLNRLLASGVADRLCAGLPRLTAVLVGLLALGAGALTRDAGLSSVLGALLVALTIPVRRTASWAAAARSTGRAGRALVPVFFVVTGVTLLTGSTAALPWEAALIATALGVAGKVGGGYLGARWAGEGPRTALRVGVLVNTRGLTEIVVLQAGFTAGVLTPGLFAALLVMALTTTGLTGPLLSALDRRAPVRSGAP
jgi:Kef-type K+ transport system membrane component KefB